jgi:hypothetical protein
LTALSSVAVAQPAFDILSSNAEIFVTRETKPADLIALALVLVLAPPAVLWLSEVVIGLGLPRSRQIAHATLAALVIALITVEGLKRQTDIGPGGLVALGVVLGLAGGLLVLRAETVRLWLRILAIAPIVFAVNFLFFSPVTSAVMTQAPDPAGVAVGNPRRVVMIVLDELPTESLLDGTGKVDADLFPNLAALASESTWYRNHTTVAPNTTAALPAIVTASRPRDAASAAVAATSPRSLFTLLGETYEMNVHEVETRLCPRTLCNQRPSPGARSGFRLLVYDTYDLWRDFASPARQGAGVDFAGGKLIGARNAQQDGYRFIRSLRPTDRPRFDFLHVLLPHQAWHYLPTGQDYRFAGRERVSQLNGQEVIGAPRGLWGDYSWWESAWTARLGRQRHLLQVGATDRLIGDIVTKLRAIDAYEDSLIIVTADHGVAFNDGDPVRGLSRGNYPQIAWVPLFVKAPGQRTPVVDDAPARTIDIVPTIADHLDIRLPWEVDGRSLAKPAPAGQPVEVFDWTLSPWKPPPGEQYVTLPARKGFAEVLRGQASAAEGDPALRLYSLGKYGSLLGQRPEAFEKQVLEPPTGIIDRTGGKRQAEPGAHRVPWIVVEGSIAGASSDVPLVITVNGVIAGFSATASPITVASFNPFWTVVAPEMFRAGTNRIGVYLVHGPPDDPTLISVPLRN